LIVAKFAHHTSAFQPRVRRRRGSTVAILPRDCRLHFREYASQESQHGIQRPKTCGSSGDDMFDTADAVSPASTVCPWKGVTTGFMCCPPAAGRSLHPEIGDDGNAEEKGETLLKSHGLHGAPPEIRRVVAAARELGWRWRQPGALDAWRPRGGDTLPVAAIEAATALLVIVQFFSPVSNPCADNIGQPTSEAATLQPASVPSAAWTLQVHAWRATIHHCSSLLSEI
jgi:hypothetical protein